MSNLDAKILAELEREDPETAQAYYEELQVREAEENQLISDDDKDEYVFEFGGE